MLNASDVQFCTFGSAQVGSVQVGSVQVGSAQVGSAQVGSAQVGSAQVGSAQVGSAQVGSVQVGSAQVGSVRCSDRLAPLRSAFLAAASCNASLSVRSDETNRTASVTLLISTMTSPLRR